MRQPRRITGGEPARRAANLLPGADSRWRADPASPLWVVFRDQGDRKSVVASPRLMTSPRA
jgi:hypothetical protein